VNVLGAATVVGTVGGVDAQSRLRAHRMSLPVHHLYHRHHTQTQTSISPTLITAVSHSNKNLINLQPVSHSPPHIYNETRISRTEHHQHAVISVSQQQNSVRVAQKKTANKRAEVLLKSME